MHKFLSIIIGLILMLSLASCGTKSPTTSTTEPSTSIPSTDTNPITTDTKEDDPYMNKTLELIIDGTKVDVYWLDNESVKALKELAKDGLTIELHQYGDFEQTGSLGTTIKSNDEQMNVGPGDIVLYQSNQICLYYDNNSWSFTKLGHISLSKSELKELLGASEHITITLNLK